MLAELVGWYAGQDQNRRRYPRVRKNYNGKYSINGGRTWSSLRGVDLGGGGMCAYSDREIGAGILDVVLMLDGKEVPFKAQPVWSTESTEGGKKTYCHGIQFTSIDAANWEIIMQWVTGKAYVDYGQTPALRIADTEVAHFLPDRLRKGIFTELVRLGRYDGMPENPPQFDYSGVKLVNGRPMHRFTIYSKVKMMGAEVRHTTGMLCDDAGEEITVLN